MPERIILLNGKARQVFRYTELAAKEHGAVTLRDIAAPDPLAEEKQAEAWRDYQDRQQAWREETNR